MFYRKIERKCSGMENINSFLIEFKVNLINQCHWVCFLYLHLESGQ